MFVVVALVVVVGLICGRRLQERLRKGTTVPVRFIIGPAGSGKTHYCLEALRACERSGRPGIYLVPEQSTYTADRELLEVPDLPGLRHVRILSFLRLAWWLRDLTGAPAPPVISKAARPMLLRAVLRRLSPEELGPLAPLKDRPGFLEEMGRFIGEVRNHGAGEFVFRVRRETDEAGSPAHDATHPGVRRKLRALMTAFEAYNTTLRDLGWTDPEEALAGVPVLIDAQREPLRSTRMLVDGFLSWTRREREILVALAYQGAHLEVALCCDPVEDGAASPEIRAPFLPVRRSLETLHSAMEKAGVKIDPPLRLVRELGPHRFTAAALDRIENGLYRHEPPKKTSPERPGAAAGAPVPEWPTQAARVQLKSASDPRQEVLEWARTIDRWMRDPATPTPPGRIAILLRGIEPYRDLIRRIFPLYHIPYFLDERRSLLAHPRVRLLLGACEVVLSGWRRDAVIAFLRNPMLGAAPASVDLMENLSLQYGHDFEAWYAPGWPEFPMPLRVRSVRRREVEDRLDAEASDEESTGVEPDDESTGGGGEDFDSDDAGVDRRAGPGLVARIDPLRLRLLLPVRRMMESWSVSGGLPGADAVSALRRLETELAATAGAGIRPVRDDRIWDGQVRDAVDALLDEVARLWGELPVSLEEFARTFRQGLETVRIGIPPLRLDQVVIGEVQRSRLTGIRRAIVGGLIDGVFPRVVTDDSVLNEQDRTALAGLDAPLGPTAVQRQEEEVYLFYISLTRASEELLLTWTRMDAQGRSVSRSLLLDEVERALSGALGDGGTNDRAATQAERAQTPPEAEATLLERAQTARELAEQVVSDLAGWITPAEGDTAPDPLLIELYNQAHAEPDPFQATPTAEDSDARRTVRELIDRSRPALVYSPSSYLEQPLLERVFVPGDFPSSVSRLREYVDCPYLSFARRRLRLEPRPRAEVSPLETGNLAHAALDRFFQQPLESNHAVIEHRLSEIFNDLKHRPEFQAFQVDEASRYRWHSTYLSLCRFLRVETGRLASNPYRIERRELSFGPELGTAVSIPLSEGENLLLLGRIDRLDGRREGRKTYGLVLDYKRSQRSGLPGKLERGLDLQLAAYLLFVQDVLGWIPAGGLYVPVLPPPVQEENLKEETKNPISLKVHGLFLRDEREAIDSGTDMLVRSGGTAHQALAGPEDMNRLLTRARAWLRSYASTLRSGWIGAHPLEETRGRPVCDNCDFGAVCRFQPGRDPTRHEPGQGMCDPPPSEEET
jgi:ATP-dependent helicase/nuclease subunit B